MFESSVRPLSVEKSKFFPSFRFGVRFTSSISSHGPGPSSLGLSIDGESSLSSMIAADSQSSTELRSKGLAVSFDFV